MQVARHARCSKFSKKLGSRMVDFSFYAANHRFVAETDESHDAISQRIQEYIDVLINSLETTECDAQQALMKYVKKLDFSPASLGHLDKIINIVCNPPEEKNIQALVLAFGGYVGRVLENTFEGNWRASHNEFNESVYVTDTGFAFHPFSWTLERLKEDDLLLDKFNVIAGMAKGFGVTRKQQ